VPAVSEAFALCHVVDRQVGDAQVRAISSVATEVPMSWPTTKTGGEPARRTCVGLPGERVDVVARLL